MVIILLIIWAVFGSFSSCSSLSHFYVRSMYEYIPLHATQFPDLNVPFYCPMKPHFVRSQVELALDVESIVPQFIRRRFVVKSRTIRPNINRHRCTLFRRIMAESELSSDAIVKALNPELVSFFRCLPSSLQYHPSVIFPKTA